MSRGTLRLSDVEVVVLDEADEMLDMGFAEDIGAILLPPRRAVGFRPTKVGGARIVKIGVGAALDRRGDL